MQIDTTRFGPLEIEPADLLLFPNGLVAFEDCRHWVLLADADNSLVGWLQSASRADVAIPVVSPRRFKTDYQIRINKTQLAPLHLRAVHEAYVLTIVGRNERGLTLNLKAPLVVNLDRRLGRQVVAIDDQPLQFELAPQPAALRKVG